MGSRDFGRVCLAVALLAGGFGAAGVSAAEPREVVRPVVRSAAPQSAAMMRSAPPTSSKPPAMTAAMRSEAGRGPSLSSGAAAQAAVPTETPLVQPDSDRVAAAVDRLIESELKGKRARISPEARDEDFVRRATFDLIGRVPTPEEIAMYERRPSGQRRTEWVDHLVRGEAFARNVARYWRDVLLERAVRDQDRGVAEDAFIDWMTRQVASNQGWDRIARAMITSTASIPGDGSGAMIYLQDADPNEVAAETARVFLGVQMQCAQCHDHPMADYKREQFHQLAAFFPRVRLERIEDEITEEVTYAIRSSDPDAPVQAVMASNNPYAGYDAKTILASFDDDGNGRLDAQELGGSELGERLSRVDADMDMAMSLPEIERALRLGSRAAPTRGEHLMPDLDAPELPGELIHPAVFTDDSAPAPYLPDLERRDWLAGKIASKDTPLFARAMVNRVWTELLGEGFYLRPDDLTEEEPDLFPEVLHLLEEGFVRSGYDLRWLYRTVARTKAYQRSIREVRPAKTSQAYASAIPTRLRADALFSSLETIFSGGESAFLQRISRMTGGSESMMSADALEGPRDQFRRLFHYDPSTPQADILGSVPQALYLMNSRALHRLITADKGTPFATIVATAASPADAVTQTYLLVLGRRPTRDELGSCVQYVAGVGKRREALEDIVWCLLNSSEFITRR